MTIINIYFIILSRIDEKGGVILSASNTIKKILLDKHMTVKQLAEKLGIKPQVLSNKLYRDTFTYSDYVKIANLLECDVKTISRESTIEYVNEP